MKQLKMLEAVNTKGKHPTSNKISFRLGVNILNIYQNYKKNETIRAQQTDV